jgi:hypothetical protein
MMRVGHRRQSHRKGSTILEFAFVLPVAVTLLVGGMSLGIMCMRTMQAGDLARQVSLLADSGVDLGTSGGQQQVIEKGRGLGLESGKAVVYITKIVREPAGLRVDRSYHMGNYQRWRSGLWRLEDAAELEPGEEAWVVEVFAESGSVVSLLPKTVKAKNVL